MKTSMDQKCCSGVFSSLFFTLFIAINVGYFHCLDLDTRLSALAYACLLEFLAFGLAFECASMILGLFLDELVTPRLSALEDFPKVALVCCTCDDADEGILQKLNGQCYPNLDVYVLDDSRRAESKDTVDSAGLTVVRRSNRAGFKAGNLNNWLMKFGREYEYFIVADADSEFPDDFVKEMVCYAEHPANGRIAIFESVIKPSNVNNVFARLQGLMTPIITRLKLRVDNRCNSVLSVGHNNLFRTKVILDCGYFAETYVAEDYATSIEVIRYERWECKVVPVTSNERLPSNLREYARRQARWAFQTFQLGSISLSGIPFIVRLKLIRAVHSYLESLVIPAGVILLGCTILWLSIAFDGDPGTLEHLWSAKILLFWFFYLFLPLAIRFVLVMHLSVSVGEFLKSTLFHGALFVACMWPTVIHLLKRWLSRRSGFEVTGRSQPPSLAQILKIGGPGFGLFWGLLLVVVANPYLVGFNIIWILPASLSPFIIYHFQGSER